MAKIGKVTAGGYGKGAGKVDPSTTDVPTVTQTYSTADTTLTQTSTADAPAGGSGATAGAYDTANHRDAAIAVINANRADIVTLQKVLNTVIDALQAAGILA